MRILRECVLGRARWLLSVWAWFGLGFSSSAMWVRGVDVAVVRCTQLCHNNDLISMQSLVWFIDGIGRMICDRMNDANLSDANMKFMGIVISGCENAWCAAVREIRAFQIHWNSWRRKANERSNGNETRTKTLAVDQWHCNSPMRLSLDVVAFQWMPYSVQHEFHFSYRLPMISFAPSLFRSVSMVLTRAVSILISLLFVYDFILLSVWASKSAFKMLIVI